MCGSTVFAERLRFLREKSGISQGDLAKELGVSRGAISFYENGDRTPNIDFLCDVSVYFNAPVEYLLGLRENYREADNPCDLFFLSDAAISNLLECSDCGELLSDVLEHEDFATFFHIFERYAIVKREAFRNYVDNPGMSFELIDEKALGGRSYASVDEEYMEYRLTAFFMDILKSAAERYMGRGVDRKKLEALVRSNEKIMQMEEERRKKEVEKTARLNEIYKMQQERRIQALERIHGQKAGD